MRAKNILETIGKTPLVKLNKIYTNSDVEIWLKLEKLNPGGSIKDRVALQMIIDAEKQGELKEKMTILEASSGNTGVGLAMVAAIKGYSVHIVVSSNISEQKKKLMKKFGAKIIEDKNAKDTADAIKIAKEMLKKEKDKYWYANQHENESNPKSHKETFREIIGDIPNLTHVVAGAGTLGTLLGLGKRLKQYNSNIDIVAVFPKESESISGLRRRGEKIPFWDEKNVDIIYHVSSREVKEVVDKVAKGEGLLIGDSGAAAISASLKLARKVSNARIVTIIPDGGERYFD